MTKRGLGVVVVLLLAAAGCVPGGTSAQQVELVAGGGETDGGPAADAFIDGRLVDMTMDRAGTLRVLTDDGGVATMWTVRGGQLSHVAVPGLKADYVSQMTAAPDGAVYVALWNGEGGVWQITRAGIPEELRVPWPGGEISERPAVRREIVALYEAACEKLGIEPRPHA